MNNKLQINVINNNLINYLIIYQNYKKMLFKKFRFHHKKMKEKKNNF